MDESKDDQPPVPVTRHDDPEPEPELEPVKPEPVNKEEPTAIPLSKPPRKRSSSKKPLLIVLGVVLLVIAAVAVYLLFLKKDSAPPATTKSPTPPATVNVETTPSSANTKHYTSTVKGLDLSFDYPDNWTVSMAKDAKDPNIQYIVVTSTPSAITNDKGAEVTGKVLILFRPDDSDLAELSADSNASAAQDSQQIAYTKPTANQRQYPYVSFIHFGGDRTSSNPFEEIINTGGIQITKSTIVSASTVANVDPLVSAGLYVCKTEDCPTTGTPNLSITDDTWQNNDTLKKVKALFESLIIN